MILVGSPADLSSGRGEPALTVADTAARLGVSESKIRSMIKNGIVNPCARIAKVQLFRASDVERLRADLDRE